MTTKQEQHRIGAVCTSSTHTSRQSEFRVSGIGCAVRDVPLIQRSLLEATPGVENVTVNAATQVVRVHHNASLVSASQLATQLQNRTGMGAEILVDGAEAPLLVQSLFVVSKFSLVVVDKDRLDLLLQAYDTTQVESFGWEEGSRILTVVHNPYTLHTAELQTALQEDEASANQVEVVVNGSDPNNQTPIDYQALAESTPDSPSATTPSNTTSDMYPPPQVILMCLFWMISMLSFIGGPLQHLQYVALVSVAIGLPQMVQNAIDLLRRQMQFDGNGTVVLATLGAMVLGEFLEAAFLVSLFALSSQWLEHRTTARARQALADTVQCQPDKANLLDPHTQKLWTVPAAAVPIGALVSVKTGDRIPCDGVVVEGQSTVDKSSLTRESRPIPKRPKDRVSGGTVNTGVGQLVIRTTCTSDHSAVARLLRLVEEAQTNRSETEKTMDEFAKYYTPIVLLAAICMSTIPWAFGADTGRKWTHNGLVWIVLAAPCALILSTPVCYVAGLAVTAQNGIWIKGGAFLEALGQIKHVCFDKTGTLTTGEFRLLHLEVVGESLITRQQVLQYLLLMEERAAHPVAQAILSATRSEGVSIPKQMVLQKHTILQGEGVSGVINGRNVFVGNERLFERLGMISSLPAEFRSQINSWQSLGGTIGFIGVQDLGIVGAYCASDAIRPEAAAVVHALKIQGITLSMLTGDNHTAAESVAKQLAWHHKTEPKNKIRANLLPAEKLAFVEELIALSSQQDGCRRRKHLVLFCGDGVNDAPALAAAHVGVAMGSGATVAMETAHVTLLDPSLRKLEFAIQTGRRVRRKIVENIVVVVALKGAVMVWALLGTAIAPSLWVAIGTDVGSLLLVTLNAVSLLPVPTRSPAFPSTR